jgi:uroporphyrinogen decarboxylase
MWGILFKEGNKFMTDRERFLNIMEFKSVDRYPNYELGVWGQAIDRWYSEGLPRDVCYWNWFEGEPYFGIDKRGFIPVKAGMIPGFDEETIEETERYIVFRDSIGRLRKAMKEGTVRGTRPSMDQYLDFPVKDKKSFEDLKKGYDPYSPVRYPMWWDELAKLWRDRDYPLCLFVNGQIGFYWTLREWVGTENLSYMFYDDPSLVHEMLDFIADFITDVSTRALSDVQIDYFNFSEDLAGKSGPLISPKIYKEFFVPRVRRVIEHFKKFRVRYFWVDSDGNFEVLIPYMLEAGINCIWPLEQASGMDPVKLRKRYGKDLVLCGGIDKRELTKDKASIERELYSKIPYLLEQGGYIPHLDHTFPPDISYENFLYYMELKEKLLRGG